MAGRIIYSILAATCLVIPAEVRAQGYGYPAMQAGYPPTQGGAPSAGHWAPPPVAGGPYQYGPPPQFGPPPQNVQPQGGRKNLPQRWGRNIIGDSRNDGSMPLYYDPQHPAFATSYDRPETAVPGVGYYRQDNIVTSLETADDDYFDEGPLERLLESVSRNSWIRFEYRLMEFEKPTGNTLLGAPTQFTDIPQVPFPVFNNAAPPVQIGTAFVPTLDDIEFQDNNGLGATLGVPLRFGTLEVSAFATEQSSTQIQFGPFTNQPGRFIGTTVLVNGAVSNTILLYTQFTATYTTDYWGTEAVVAFDWDRTPPGEGFHIYPLFGFRFLNLQEQLNQVGDFAPGGGVPSLTSRIDSDSSNNIFGSVFGLRLEMEHRWFRAGIEPRIQLGFDSYRNRVTTNNLRAATDPEQVTEEDDLIFSPAAEINAYLRVPVSDSLTLYGGYNILQLARITRPHENIRYNISPNLNAPPGTVVDTELTDFKLEYLYFGGEYTFK